VKPFGAVNGSEKMALINDEMKDVASKARIFAVATSSLDGEPNVVAITFAKVLSDDEFLLMDNFMEKTEANLKANPRVAISCWDLNPQTKVNRGYQFKGDASFEYSGKVFEEGCQWVKSLKPQIQSKAVIIVKVTSIYNLEPHAKK
jgi:predicted pyridoxine 5'-phosphate oxidase superfamily flavin-nucleotide-binding protein